MTEQVEMKSVNSAVKVKGTPSEEGTFTAIVSVWDNIDSYGDVMRKGAFAESLAEWETRDYEIPFLWSHQTEDPFAYIGHITSARETDEGLEVTGQFDMENPNGVQAYKLLKGRRVREFSFGFKIRDYSMADVDGYRVRELNSVDLSEVSMTQFGANPNTRLVDVKSAPESDEKSAESDTLQPLTVADLDNAIAEMKSLSVSVEQILTKFTVARDQLTKTVDDEEQTEDEVETVENETQAAASPVTADEEPSEVKSANVDETAVANAQHLKTYIQAKNIERKFLK